MNWSLSCFAIIMISWCFPFHCQAMHTTPQQALHWSLLLCSVHCTAQLGCWLVVVGHWLVSHSQVSRLPRLWSRRRSLLSHCDSDRTGLATLAGQVNIRGRRRKNVETREMCHTAPATPLIYVTFYWNEISAKRLSIAHYITIIHWQIWLYDDIWGIQS